MNRVTASAIAFLSFSLAAGAQGKLPHFEPDPFWPKPLPKQLDDRTGFGRSRRRARSHWDSPGRVLLMTMINTAYRRRAIAAFRRLPVRFDQAGNVVSSVGGSGEGYEWPDNEHGIFVDAKDNVWITGNGDKDAQILKFTRAGKFLMQIGHHGKSGAATTRRIWDVPRRWW